jgi:hypothetical protein
MGFFSCLLLFLWFNETFPRQTGACSSFCETAKGLTRYVDDFVDVGSISKYTMSSLSEDPT